MTRLRQARLRTDFERPGNRTTYRSQITSPIAPSSGVIMTEGVSADRAGSVRVGDRRVHRIGLGTNRVTDNPTVRAFLRRAVDLGIDFIDTADVYTSGASEETIGAVFPSAADDVLVATKGGLVRTPRGYEEDGRPAHLREAVERSLHRLRKDRLELYFLHRVDPHVPIEESLGALRQLQKEGRIRRIGVSNVTVPELERTRKIVTVVSVENRYSVMEREHEDVLRYCEDHDIVFVPWSPFLRGTIGESMPIAQVAKKCGATPHQVALAWLLDHSSVILPIPGTLSEKHLEENLAAANVTLDSEDVRALDERLTGRPS